MPTELPLPTRLPLAGRFAIDQTCIDCRLCQDLAPENFECDVDNDVHYVCKQPETMDELECVIDALESCPTESIRYLAASTEE
ncbi:ferredoxin [Streptomyces spectabilis]|uniref:Ferredoxin n=1 Tax=Streptomyces spectabilis TaxID=68270 RepID=A0A516RHL2_STRST|nr:ferredoxin [Streptomyces spectabilis]QDQ15150.1 ferredoxin [Streptomyces spectabilis]